MIARFYTVLCAFWLLSFYATPISAQLELKVQLIGLNQWGVFAKPVGVSPDSTTITGSGQVTIVMPKDFQWSDLESESGLWINNQTVNSPLEDPNLKYVSFVLQQAEPDYPIRYQAGLETFLFSFKMEGCPDFLYLIDCGTPTQSDVFCPHNSVNSNPGNDLSVIQFGGGVTYYNYTNNYAPHAWDCRDSDGDGFANGWEDTNGNGQYDPNVDAADLYDENSPAIANGLNFKVGLIEENKWGVFLKPEGISPSENIITGEGHLTLVMPKNYAWTDMQSVNGKWVNSYVNNGPTNNPDLQHVGFGLEEAEPNFPIPYQAGEETLLFTFRGLGACPDFLYIIDCGTPNQSDPACGPNSVDEGIMNYFSAIDFGPGGLEFYGFSDLYAPHAWDCHDNDGDGVVNGLEDTNGNGVYDIGIDSSDLNDMDDPYLTSGLHLKLQLLEENKWGVFVKPVGIEPDSNTITGTGNITVVMPIGFSYNSLESINGLWTDNAIVNGPMENPSRRYVSFGLQTAEPTHPIIYQEGEETLLFTFEGEGACPDTMFLIDCGTPFESDPFCPDPINSVNSNPPNKLSVIQFGDSTQFYNFSRNYAFSAWSCHDNDGDGILNALEDTNGNGVYDGEDSSDINNPCDPFQIESATLNYINGYDVICAGDASDVAYLIVDIIGGWEPYTIILETEASIPDTIFQYRIGDSIAVVPHVSSTYTLNTVIDSFDCEINPDSMFGSIGIEVHGPIEFTDHPMAASECSENGVTFSVAAVNNGIDGTIYYKWQESMDGGISYVDLDDGAPYNFTDNSTLEIDPIAGLHGNYYRAKIWTSVCDTVFSNGGLLVENSPITFTQEPTPVDIRVCAGNDTIVVACGSTQQGEFYYYWEYSTDNGATWDSLGIGADSNFSQSSNGTSMSSGCDTLRIHDVTGYQYTWFRAIAISPHCTGIPSSEARLLVEGPLSVGLDPVNDTICSGEAAIFTADIINSGDSNTVVSYQWQFSIDSINFHEATSLIYGGANTETLLISDVAGFHGVYFRMKATTSNCSSIYTNPAQLTVEGPITVTDQPEDVELCYNEARLIYPQVQMWALLEHSPTNGRFPMMAQTGPI